MNKANVSKENDEWTTKNEAGLEKAKYETRHFILDINIDILEAAVRHGVEA